MKVKFYIKNLEKKISSDTNEIYDYHEADLSIDEFVKAFNRFPARSDIINIGNGEIMRVIDPILSLKGHISIMCEPYNVSDDLRLHCGQKIGF